MNKNEIIENNLKILKENNKNFYVEDKDKYKYKILKNKSNISLMKYHISNPYTLDNIRNYFIINNINIKLLSNEFYGTHKPLEFEDENGHIFQRDWHNMQIRNSYLCPECSLKNKSMKRMISQDTVYKEFRDNGYILLDEYKNNNISLKCITLDGYYGRISRANLLSGKNMDIFSKLNPYTIYNINKYLNDNQIDTQILSDRFDGCEEKLKWKCSCGNVFYRKWSEFKYRNRHLCSECFKKISDNELIIQDYFDKHNIKYKIQYMFEDCKITRAMPFDFYLPNYNLCIEVQGEQHYHFVRFGGMSQHKSIERFIEQRDRDKTKKEYCENKGIDYLSIPYIDIKNNNYIKILSYKLNINE